MPTGRRLGSLPSDAIPGAPTADTGRGRTRDVGGSTHICGVSLATSAAVALVVAATAFTRTPAAARLIPLVVRYPQATVQHPLYRRVAAHATLAWAATELAMTAWETTHLADMATPQFMLLRTFGGMPVMAVLVPVVIFYIRLHLDPLAHR